MEIVRRTTTTLLASTLFVLFAVGMAAATPIDGLEARFGSESEPAPTAQAVDGLEARFGDAHAATAVPVASHLDGLETRFVGSAAPATVAGTTTASAATVTLPLMLVVVGFAALLASMVGYQAGTRRTRRLAHA